MTKKLTAVARSARGYFGIGIYHPKKPVNVGTLWRTAHNMGAAFIFTIQPRFPEKALTRARNNIGRADVALNRQPGDTTKAHRHIPYFRFEDVDHLLQASPDCRLVVVEQDDRSKPLETYHHPDRCVYLLGAEDSGLPQQVLLAADSVVAIDSERCLNVSTAGSIVIYDRNVKRRWNE